MGPGLFSAANGVSPRLGSRPRRAAPRLRSADRTCPARRRPFRRGSERPGAILIAWLRRFYAYFTSKRVVAAELVEHSSAEDPVFGAGYARVLEAGRPLLNAARKSGEVQVDLTLEQILDLIASIAKIPGADTYRKPILDAALRGLSSDSKAQ
ncbi:MAG TPA: hypothetical protein VG228_01630 [Solirubrobacteraceae bacterium]|nr:hypothetical protein [Solirubrobacteraceae bacterium]